MLKKFVKKDSKVANPKPIDGMEYCKGDRAAVKALKEFCPYVIWDKHLQKHVLDQGKVKEILLNGDFVLKAGKKFYAVSRPSLMEGYSDLDSVKPKSNKTTKKVKASKKIINC